MKAKITILGSCVTRDAFSSNNISEEFQLVDYFARSSFASRFQDSPILGVNLSDIPSAFQRRMVEYDLNKDTLKRLSQASSDWIIIDLIDERFNLFALDDGGVLTISSEFKKNCTLPEKGRVIQSLSQEFLDKWQEGWDRFVQYARDNSLLGKLILNKVYWSSITSDANSSFSAEQLNTIKLNNEKLENMYLYILKTVPEINVIDYPADMFIADVNHHWGMAEFHYTAPLYSYMLDKLRVFHAKKAHNKPIISKELPIQNISINHQLLDEYLEIEVIDPSYAKNTYYCCEVLANGKRYFISRYQASNLFKITLSVPLQRVRIKIYVRQINSDARQSFVFPIKDLYVISSSFNGMEYFCSQFQGYGKQLVCDNILHFDRFPATNFAGLDWSSNPFNNRTWQWLLLQMRLLKYVVNYTQEELQLSNIDKARDVYDYGVRAILSLKKFSETPNHSVEIWHDQGTALRLQNIYFFWMFGLCRKLITFSSAISQEIFEFIKLHLKKLSEESFYSAHTNHGFDQALVLYQITSELKFFDVGMDYQELALARIHGEIDFVFLADGGHKENSPAYLNFGLKQLLKAIELEQSYSQDEDQLSAIHLDLLEKACRNLTFTIKPDGTLPLIGDTSHFMVSNIFKSVRPTDYNEYIYSVRQGAQGKKPTENFLVLPKAGYAIARTWTKKNFLNNFHFVFKNSYFSNYHRHDDDLSFVVYDDGEDWFVDGGIYKYDNKDPHRRYIRSASSHNLTMPENAQAKRLTPEIERVGIDEYSITENVLTFSGTSQMFDGYTANRKFEVDVESKQIIIKDRIIADITDNQSVQMTPTKFVTRFFCGENKAISIEGNTIYISGKNKTISITVHSDDVFEIASINTEQKAVTGWLSKNNATLYQSGLIEVVYSNALSMQAIYTINLNNVEKRTNA